MGWIRGKKIYESRDGMFLFECPGCGGIHAFYTKNGPIVDGREQNWTYNGNGDAPTISPSLDVSKTDPAHHCHSYIRDGMITFLSDCYHPLKNTTVEIPDWDSV
jgi:hypothetical protein